VQAAIFRLAPVPHARSTLLIPPGDLLVVHGPSLPPPALRECCHRGLARRLVAVRRPAVLVLAKGERPQPWLADRRGSRLHDSADDDAIADHVEVIVVPLAGRTGGRGALEGQIVLFHFTEPTCAASCVDGPRLARDHLACSAEVACSHVSGLLVQSGWTAGPDGVREPSPHHSNGIDVPMKRQVWLGCVGSTDCAITRHCSLASSRTWLSGLSRRGHALVVLMPVHHRPGDARGLVG